MSLSHHPPRTPAMLWAIDVNHEEGERCCSSRDARDARDARDEMDARDADASARCGRFTPSLGRVNSHERPNLVVGAPEPTAVWCVVVELCIQTRKLIWAQILHHFFFPRRPLPSEQKQQ